MIWPIETPSVSPWMIERTNDRIAGRLRAVEQVARAPRSSTRPMLCSWSVSRSSSPSGPSHALRGDLQRAGEAEAGLDRDDEQVDQLGQLAGRSARGARCARRAARRRSAHRQPSGGADEERRGRPWRCSLDADGAARPHERRGRPTVSDALVAEERARLGVVYMPAATSSLAKRRPRAARLRRAKTRADASRERVEQLCGRVFLVPGAATAPRPRSRRRRCRSSVSRGRGTRGSATHERGRHGDAPARSETDEKDQRLILRP